MLINPRYLISILVVVLSWSRHIIIRLIILDQSLVRILNYLQFFFNARHHMNRLLNVLLRSRSCRLLAATLYFVNFDVVWHQAVIEERVVFTE